MAQKTVYIIGAGASAEFNLPTGDALKTQIAKSLDFPNRMDGSSQSGSHKIYDAFIELSRKTERSLDPAKKNLFLETARQIRDGLPLAISIDNYIDSHRDSEVIAQCSKIAIANAILSEETNSKLYIDPTTFKNKLELAKINKTWLIPFFQLLTENCTFEDLRERIDSIVFVVFNYDRCIEHFLYHAIQMFYKVNDNSAADLVNSMTIYHPYGKVGSLLWQESGEKIDFGGSPTATQLIQIAQRIKTFTEGSKTTDIEEIHHLLYTARRIVFLGFGFHLLNMQLMTPPNRGKTDFPTCYATTKGISENGLDGVTSRIGRLFTETNEIRYSNNNCYDFFWDYWMKLGFSE